MKKKDPKQTGPKTHAGKAISSKNAQKAAIFTKGYLESEDIAAKQAQFEALAAQWGANDPTRMLILRTIEQAHLGIERQMAAEREIIEGAMQWAGMAHNFAIAAGLDLILSVEMPAWYFDSAASAQKKLAAEIFDAYVELKALQANFSNQLASQIAIDYPNAYEYVMQKQAANQEFWSVLGERYRLKSPSLNLGAACSEIEKKYQYHLIWARHAERYEIIVAGLRSAKMRELIDWDKSNRYAVSLQNRLLKGFQALAAMDQHEEQQARPLLAPVREEVSEVITEEEHSS